MTRIIGAYQELQDSLARALRQVGQVFFGNPTDPITSRYSAKHSDLVICDPTTAGFSVVLPTINVNDIGRVVTVVNPTTSSNTVSVVPQDGATINGDSSANIYTSHSKKIFLAVKTDLWITLVDRTYLLFTTESALEEGDSIYVSVAGGFVDGDFEWSGPGGGFIGDNPDYTNFATPGDYSLTTEKWDQVRFINFWHARLSELNINTIWPVLTNIQGIRVAVNSDAFPYTWTVDLDEWDFPSTIIYMSFSDAYATFHPFDFDYSSQYDPYSDGYFYYLFLESIDAYGDITGWDVPDTMQTLGIIDTHITGDITNLERPSTLTYLGLSKNDVTGDISDWTFSVPFQTLDLSYTDAYGDIGDWTFPASMFVLFLNNSDVDGYLDNWQFPEPNLGDGYSGMYYVNVGNTNISGDISGWNIPDSLVQLFAGNTDAYGDISVWDLTDFSGSLWLGNTNVEGDMSQWANTLNNASAIQLPYTNVDGYVDGWFQNQGANISLIDLNNTAVEGDISGWRGQDNLIGIYLNNTNISYDSYNIFLEELSLDTASVYLYDCAFTKEEVDRVLSDLNDSGTQNGILRVDGTNASPSGGTSNADYLSLISKGWAVTIS